MEATLTRPTACCCRALTSSALTSSSSTSRLAALSRPSLLSGVRQKSTKARHKAALNIPPHPTFFADRSSEDHIIFNPPSSAPSVFHTPFKFLPKSDPRRRAMFDAHLFASSVTTKFANPTSSSESSSTAPTAEDLPKVLERDDPMAKNHSLTKEDVEEMRRLRLEDPVNNSVKSLAKQFGCSVMFVMMCVRAPAEHREKVHVLPHQAARERWGPKKREAREARQRRVEMLMKGEL
ncbi:mitochondrial ribosomal protein subunit L20-domain-containing protein [Podospora australis]|uniref:Mitochondrial ribosomal protein subunit L20-domain-containing protein n=1 Tax=Podospora australis TaxID=1536484 RepID=A0AAN6X4I7_9PEZI|nr:mitochondrial ribosomal protein subunit L20-domain-containing protein [Podospora australis]